jgi:hypothetical protein
MSPLKKKNFKEYIKNNIYNTSMIVYYLFYYLFPIFVLNKNTYAFVVNSFTKYSMN